GPADHARRAGGDDRGRPVGAAPDGQPRRRAAARLPHARNSGQSRESPHRRGPLDRPLPGPVFMDSDVYKWLEAAAWEMGRAPSEWLRSTSAATIDLVAAAQGADGHLHSYYTGPQPGKRRTDLAPRPQL